MSDDKEKKKSKGGCFKYLFLLIVIGMVLCAVCFFGFLFWADKSVSDGIASIKSSVTGTFNKYKPKTVTKQFFKYRDLEVKGNEGNILEVATGEQSVLLEKQRGAQVAGWNIPGVNSVSKINVPATFRYHIDLNGNWEVQADNSNRLHVMAPKLQPSLPVAFDTSKLQKDDGGFLSILTGSGLDSLEKEITPHLESKAKEAEHIAKFEKEAKKSVAKFLQTWLLQDGLWKEGHVEKIIVYFPGEEIDTSDKLIDPNLSLDQPVF